MQQSSKVNKLVTQTKSAKQNSAKLFKVQPALPKFVPNSPIQKTPVRGQIFPFKQKNPYKHVVSKVFSGIKKSMPKLTTKPILVKQKSARDSSWNILSGSGRHDTNVPSPIVAWFGDEERNPWDDKRVLNSNRTLGEITDFNRMNLMTWESGGKQSRVLRDDLTSGTWNEQNSGFKTPVPGKNRLEDLFSSAGPSPITTTSDYRPGSQIRSLFGPKPLEQTQDQGLENNFVSSFSEAIDLLQPLEDAELEFLGDSAKPIGDPLALPNTDTILRPDQAGTDVSCSHMMPHELIPPASENQPMSRDIVECRQVAHEVAEKKTTNVPDRDLGQVQEASKPASIVDNPSGSLDHQSLIGSSKEHTSALRLRLADIRHRAEHIHSLVAALSAD